MDRVLGLLIVLASISSIVLAQQLSADRVPTVVRQACEAKVSGVRKVEWKLKSDHNYEAEFKRNRVEVAAKFDSRESGLRVKSPSRQTAGRCSAVSLFRQVNLRWSMPSQRRIGRTESTS